MEKVQNHLISSIVKAMTERKCFRYKEEGHRWKDCPNKKRDQADLFFVGMSLNKDENNYH